MKPFVHLHVHSHYSILDGQASIPNLVDKAIKDGMPAIALTDHGAMFGIKEFVNYVGKKNEAILSVIQAQKQELEALQKNESDSLQASERAERIAQLTHSINEANASMLKPIVGCECYCARRSRHDKDKDEIDPYNSKRSIDASGWHLILLAKNLQGYHNLAKMVSYAWTEGQYYRPRIDKELLQRYHEGIICCSACLGGEIPQHIIANRMDEAEASVRWFKDLFGDDFYLEIQRHQTFDPLANQEVYGVQVGVNRVIMDLAARCDVKVVATNDVHFANEDDAEAHDRLICLSTSKDLDDPNRMRYTKQEWFKTTQEMNAIFADCPEALSNTVEIADKVEHYSINNKALMPDFPIPKSFADGDEYLRHLTYQGAERKYGSKLTDEICERIDFELDTIKRMGFPGYFLIVQDFIVAARSMGVAVGPGRGSAAGSAVAYCLGITDVDPIKYDLLFERFLNPDRISMPDIDIDFDDDGRALILRWVKEKYGVNRVAHIITYGTMATKSALKDVARVQKLPLSESNRLTKLIPDKIPGAKKVTLAKAIESIHELKVASLSTNPAMRDTIKYAMKLEGTVRNVGVHACGIIIGKTEISDVVPVSTAKDGEEDILVAQYEGSVIEDTGLIKMDFLGLKTLSIIKEAVSNIKKTRGIDINIDTISLNDPETFRLYSKGSTIGTFQFESAGMQKYLRELQPTTFEDLIAMNALYRPGPMEYIPSFIRRKHGQETISYDLPQMERYLKDTYGITVYQEQVMLLSRELAGFTRGMSDELRKAMGKKLVDKMAALKTKFIDGGRAKGYKEDSLDKIWSDWEKFASYAFNKSHSTCYSLVAYQTAYLKANYPAEYMAGALSCNLSNITEITKLMDECRAMKIQVLVPDVNESNKKFSVNTNGDIRFGLSAIKGVSQGAVENIIEEREANGSYKDIYDFVERIDLRQCNKRTMEAFAQSGGFDSFGLHRTQYTAQCGHEDSFVSALLRYGNIFKEEKQQENNNLFDFNDDEGMRLPKPQPEEVSQINELEILNRERELVGLYLSSNPMAPYRVITDYYCNTSMSMIAHPESLGEHQITMAGVVSKVREGLTKKNMPFTIITLEDFTGSAELPLFGDDHLKFGKYAREGLYLFVRASMQADRWIPEKMRVAIAQIDLLPSIVDNLIKKITIDLRNDCISEALSADLLEVIKANPGRARLAFRIVGAIPGCVVPLESRRMVSVGVELIKCLEQHGLQFYLE